MEQLVRPDVAGVIQVCGCASQPSAFHMHISTCAPVLTHASLGSCMCFWLVYDSHRPMWMMKWALRWEKYLFPHECKFLSLRSYKLAGLLRDAKHSFHFPLCLDWVLSTFCCGCCSVGEDCTLILMPPSQREVCLAGSVVKYLWNFHPQAQV